VLRLLDQLTLAREHLLDGLDQLLLQALRHPRVLAQPPTQVVGREERTLPPIQAAVLTELMSHRHDASTSGIKPCADHGNAAELDTERGDPPENGRLPAHHRRRGVHGRGAYDTVVSRRTTWARQCDGLVTGMDEILTHRCPDRTRPPARSSPPCLVEKCLHDNDLDGDR
jgi:hypothetical protein